VHTDLGMAEASDVVLSTYLGLRRNTPVCESDHVMALGAGACVAAEGVTGA
jgi:hypothetical protein